MPRKPGPGRKRLGGSRVAVRLSDAQHAALSAAAREARADLSTFVREMALRGAGMAQLSEHAWLATEGRTMGNRTEDDRTVTAILGRDGMGEGATSEDYDAWVAYVSDRIDERSGRDVTVETTPEGRGVQETRLIGASDDKQAVRDALSDLWEEFCADASAWPARETAS